MSHREMNPPLQAKSGVSETIDRQEPADDLLGAKKAPRKTPRLSTRKKALAALFGALVLGGGSYFGYQSYLYVSTDNAMIQAQTTLLSSRVSGIIVSADVQENQKVTAGQVLLEIRPDDYQAALDRQQSDMESLQAQVTGARTNFERTRKLFDQGASTQERLDAATTQLRATEAQLKAAKAQVNQAKLSLGYTKIVAPADGKVGRKSFEVGMLAPVGQPLLGFVA